MSNSNVQEALAEPEEGKSTPEERNLDGAMGAVVAALVLGIRRDTTNRGALKRSKENPEE